MHASERYINTSFTTTDNAFSLLGGVYSWAVVGTFNSTTVTLDALGPDGSTWQNVKNLSGTAASLTASGRVDSLWLPPGSYRFSVSATATSLAAIVVSVPTP